MATLARVLLRTGRIEEGKAFADAAVTRAEREGLLEPLPWALIQAGEARFAEGAVDAATERFTRALTIATETHIVSWQALALRGLGRVARAQGDESRAISLLREALLREEAARGHRRIVATILADLTELEHGRNPNLVEKGLRIAEAGSMTDLAERLRRFAPSHTVRHTVAP
jgi:tetratricopeptide (TPR) repeat protein